MAIKKFVDGINEAIKEEMRKNQDIFVMGLDNAFVGGIRGVTKGILDEFGEKRAWDCPICEPTYVGVCIGAATAGLHPIVEVMYSDFLHVCSDEICNTIAKKHYCTNGTVKMPITIRSCTGRGHGGDACHSQVMEAYYLHTPGLQVVFPSTPADAKGLMKTVLSQENPTIFLEHKLLYQIKGEIPEEETYIPLGKAKTMREGSDVTVVTWGIFCKPCMDAAEIAAKSGVNAEVIDLRTIVPMDREAILQSVEKTGKLMVVEEGTLTGGVGAEIAAFTMEKNFYNLQAPVVRIAAADVPISYTPALVEAQFPNKNSIADAILRLAAE